MPHEIKSLPEDVVHLIAAGEVIDSLAAVVRELSENAIDAGATRITIALWLDRWRIRVADNGTGMSLTNLKQAATAHSTSKIRDRQDLWQITSLGFRGEALHSLAQLSHLQIASRSTLPPENSASDPDNSSSGWLATYDLRGNVSDLEPVAIATGTIVTADHIFANLPGRRKGLPSLAQQLRAIQLTVYHFALCHPHITWQVQQGDRDWLTLFPGNSPRVLLPQILREVEVGDLQEVGRWMGGWVDGEDREGGEEEDGEGREHREGVALSPQSSVFSTSPPSPQSLAPSPSLYLLLGLPDRCHRHRPDWIKVAVNGRIVQMPALEQTILAGFRRMLPRDRYPVCVLHLRVPPTQIDWNRHPAKTEIYLQDLPQWQERITQAIAEALRLKPESLPDGAHTARVGDVLKAAEAAGSYSAKSSLESSITAPTSLPLKAIAQVHNTYVLAEHPTGIWLIEQHIAHERVLYEELGDHWQFVTLDSPMILHHLTTAQQEQLHRIGIEVEPFGDEAWMVRSIPKLLATRDDCGDALVELSLGGDLQAAQAAIACRSAIRNGTPLTQTEMQNLLDRWQQTRNPRTCPHGRPICLALEESSLSRFFRRHWMIGKSHGL